MSLTTRHLFLFLAALSAAAAVGCGGDKEECGPVEVTIGDDDESCPKPSTPSCPDPGPATCPEPSSDAGSAPADVPPSPAPPTYWSAEATTTVDDVLFAEHAGERIFALGFDAKKGSIWDGATGKDECDKDAGVGYLFPLFDTYARAAAAGANFAFIWGYPKPDWEHYDDWLDAISMFYGRWVGDMGTARPADKDVTPIIYNAWGESDFDNPDIEGTIERHNAEFEEWRTRTGRYSPEEMPNLPPFEELPWFAWHPTWRSSGGGDGKGELLTDEQARGMINTSNMVIGDNYSYVTNRHDSRLNPVTGQRGEPGEGYDDWLAVADDENSGKFKAAWRVVDAVERFAERPILRWMWIQGYSFGYSLGKSMCEKGGSDTWATGWFPTFSYLRKEVCSVIAGGGTGIVFFAYMSAHPRDGEKVETIFSALSHEEVYGPALLSPRLDLGDQDLRHLGEGGRIHAIAKWDEESRRAFLIGANPGPWETRAEVTFPWSLDKVEMLMWGSPRFVESPRLSIDDRKLRVVAPMDEGFIIRVTPLFAP